VDDACYYDLDRYGRSANLQGSLATHAALVELVRVPVGVPARVYALALLPGSVASVVASEGKHCPYMCSKVITYLVVLLILVVLLWLIGFPLLGLLSLLSLLVLLCCGLRYLDLRVHLLDLGKIRVHEVAE